MSGGWAQALCLGAVDSQQLALGCYDPEPGPFPPEERKEHGGAGGTSSPGPRPVTCAFQQSHPEPTAT